MTKPITESKAESKTTTKAATSSKTKTATKAPAKATTKTAAAPKAVAEKKPAAAKTAKATTTRKKAKTGNTVPLEQRAHYVEIAAFYIAERRGFAPANPMDDWLAAEAEIDSLLAQGKLG